MKQKRLFRNLLIMLLTLAMLPLGGFTAIAENAGSDSNPWTVTSPGGVIAVTVQLDENAGSLTWAVTSNGTTVVSETSALGIRFAECDFTSGLEFVSRTDKTVDETYRMISGKASSARNYARESTLRFQKDAFYFDLIVRAYDDGFAYRYEISRQDGGSIGMTAAVECGSFALPGNCEMYMMGGLLEAGLSNKFSYENYMQKRYSKDQKDLYFFFPALYRASASTDCWVLLSEADLYGDAYIGSMLAGEADNVFRIHSAPIPDASVSVSIPFSTPWRCGIVGGLGTIVESNLIENLNPPADADSDWSWVQPGVTAWTWLSENLSAGQSNPETICKYIDMAAEMGWQYVTLDEGWQPKAPEGSDRKYSGYHNWFDGILNYASERRIGILVWVHSADLNTPEKRTVLSEWSAKGIKGIKVDFFESENAATIQLYEDIYRACAEQKLIVNVHGSNKPTGERRQYPNVLNREGVRGQEYEYNSTASPYYDASRSLYSSTVLPFTRGVVGPMDVTPRINSMTYTGVTTGQLMAMTVMYESGLPSMASTAEEYLRSPAYLLYKDLPAAWDETRFVAGYPGEYAVLARRSGAQWYVAGVTAASRTAGVTFDFLPENEEYVAILFRDSDQYNVAVEEIVTVKKGDTVSVPMLAAGGFAMRLIRKSEAPTDITSGLTNYTAFTGEVFRIDTGLDEKTASAHLRWSSSNSSVAEVVDGRVTAHHAGSAVITVSSLVDGSVLERYQITVKEPTAATVQIPDGAATVTVDGKVYTVLRSAEDLSKLGTAGNYILANNLDGTGKTYSTSVVKMASGVLLDGNGFGFVNFTINATGTAALLDYEAAGTEQIIIRNIFFGTTGAPIGITLNGSWAGGVFADHANSNLLAECVTFHVKSNCSQNRNFGGLLGTLKGRLTLRNCLIDVNMTSTSTWSAGTIAGESAATSRLAMNNCVLTGSITHTNGTLGGMIGNAHGDAVVTDCANSVAVNGGAGKHVGGFVGYWQPNDNKYQNMLRFTNCIREGNITVGDNVGGYIGYVKTGAVMFHNCRNKGNLTSGNAGGFVGTLDTATNITFQGCTNEGLIKASQNAGGFLAYASDWCVTALWFTDCVNKGNVSTNSGTNHAGGFVGLMNDNDKGKEFFRGCINLGIITGGENAGGFAGKAPCPNTFENCENRGAVTASSNTAGFVGYAGNTTFSDCANRGSITNGTAAGFAGTGGPFTIRNSINYGTINATSHAGGFVGWSNASNTAGNIANLGSISTTGNSNIGNIGGAFNLTSLKNAYGFGKVTAPASAKTGVLVGDDQTVSGAEGNFYLAVAGEGVNLKGTDAQGLLAPEAALAKLKDAFGKDFMIGDDGLPVPAVPVLQGVQETEAQDGIYKIRLVASLNSLNYTYAGFRLTKIYTDASGNEVRIPADEYCSKMYTSILGSEEAGSLTPVTAQEMGGKYLYALTLTGVPTALGTVILEVTAFATDADGNTYLGATYRITYDSGLFAGVECLTK